MARAPRSNNAKTKAKINADDRSRRKAKLRNLRTFLLIAFTVTSVASPSAGLAAMASIDFEGAWCARHRPAPTTRTARTPLITFCARARAPGRPVFPAAGAPLPAMRAVPVKLTRPASPSPHTHLPSSPAPERLSARARPRAPRSAWYHPRRAGAARGAPRRLPPLQVRAAPAAPSCAAPTIQRNPRHPGAGAGVCR